jgi:hypothetical protein
MHTQKRRITIGKNINQNQTKILQLKNYTQGFSTLEINDETLEPILQIKYTIRLL